MALPQLYDKVHTAVKATLPTEHYLSFTTDVWTASDVNASLMSFTAHWIDANDFKRKSAVLHVLPLEESHTGEYLAQKYLEMLDSWNIRKEQVHLVLLPI